MFHGNERGQIGLSFFLFLVLIGMIAGGFYMVDQLGLFNIKEQVYGYLAPVPVVGEYIVPSPISQEAYQTQQLRQLRENLGQRKQKLEQRQNKLDDLEQQLQQRRRQLERQEETIQQREEALAQRRSRFEDEQSRIDYLANLYSNMPPAAAAARLQNIQNDRVVISILRQMPNQNSSIIMTNINDQRAAVLTRKMAQYP
jgi:flagellar motility protein MotE (MotC chaperone)